MRQLTTHHLAPQLYDLLMIPLAWFAAFFVRANLSYMPAAELAMALTVFPYLLLVQYAAMRWFGLHKTVWRYSSINELAKLLQAVLLGVTALAAGLFLTTRLHGVPRSIFPLYSLILTAGLAGGRFVVRWLHQQTPTNTQDARVLVVGAGQAGASLVADLLRDQAYAYTPVGFVDDDQSKQGRDIHGVAVLGGCEVIPQLVTDLDVELILIALPSANAAEIRRVVEFCRQTNCPFRILPSFNDLVDGRVSIDALREVSVQDLLGRDPVQLDWTHLGEAISKQSVMVTGAGGSIGSELCRQIARLRPSQLIAVDHSEFALYQLERRLRAEFPTVTLQVILLNVGCEVGMSRVMQQAKPKRVFHAAAYKHVPMLQYQVCTALRNNVLGTLSVAKAAVQARVETFVLISTDKAVNTTNFMGASKRLAELVCQWVGAQATTRFVTVRFGNVLDSAGSVIPLFKEQIAAGGPITVTHPEITRFFMSIPEASQLILQASVFGEGGEVFVLDMGEPIAITQLAEQMIDLAQQAIEIEYIGLRPGEKLHEELFYQHENLQPTPHPKIMMAKTDQASPDMPSLVQQVQQLVAKHDEAAAVALLSQFVAVEQGEPA